MNFLYSELNPALLKEYLKWKKYDTLPLAIEKYYMSIAVITNSGIDTIYLCTKINDEYKWVVLATTADNNFKELYVYVGSGKFDVSYIAPILKGEFALYTKYENDTSKHYFFLSSYENKLYKLIDDKGTTVLLDGSNGTYICETHSHEEGLILITSGDGTKVVPSKVKLEKIVSDLYEYIEKFSYFTVTDYEGLEKGTVKLTYKETLPFIVNYAIYDSNGNKIEKLSLASKTNLGGIKLGFSTSEEDSNYEVQVDSNGRAYVNVPWEDTTYEFDGVYDPEDNKAATVETVTNSANKVVKELKEYTDSSITTSLTDYVNQLDGVSTNGVITDITKNGKILTVSSTSLKTTSPIASGDDIEFINTISQASNGKISATKKTVRVYAGSSAGLVPNGGSASSFLRGDGSWDTLGNSIYTNSTTILSEKSTTNELPTAKTVFESLAKNKEDTLNAIQVEGDVITYENNTIGTTITFKDYVQE